MNKVILLGNLCKDIDLRKTQMNDTGVYVLMNTLAVRNDYKTNGEYGTQFIDFVAWRQNAEFLGKYASKGSQVLIEGRLTKRSYDRQDGTKAYITEVVAEKVKLLGSPVKSGQVAEKQQESPVESEPVNEQLTTDPFQMFGNEIEINDEDLPF